MSATSSACGRVPGRSCQGEAADAGRAGEAAAVALPVETVPARRAE